MQRNRGLNESRRVCVCSHRVQVHQNLAGQFIGCQMCACKDYINSKIKNSEKYANHSNFR